MLFKNYLMPFAFWLLLGSVQQVQALSLTLDKDFATTGDTLTISASIESAEITANQVDVYLSVQLPDGELYYLTDLGAKFSDLNVVSPLVSQWSIVTLSKVEIASFKIPSRLPNGTYKWYLTLCQVGQDVTQPANWIANASTSLTLSGGDNLNDTYYSETTAGSSDDALSLTTSVHPTAIPAFIEKSAPSPVSFSPITDRTDSSMDVDWEGEVIDSPAPPIEEESNFQSGTLTAGDLDDNLNFTAFQDYLNQQLQSDYTHILPKVDLSDRIMLRVVDKNGQGIGNAQVTLSSNQSTTFSGLTASNGNFYLFPQFNLEKLQDTRLQLAITAPQDALSSPSTASLITPLDISQRGQDQVMEITLPNATAALPVGLDLMLVIDTTGSMIDELTYIATEFRDIIAAVTAKHPNIPMRFGLIVYRDEGDAYVVQNFDFTESINLMQNQLGKQNAAGGGDYPEAMEQAMQIALQAQWQSGNVARLLFLIADAPPHEQNLAKMLTQIQNAKQAGITIYPLAASGVAEVAEYIMRIASVITQGRYLFLTDDSGVGGSHATPNSRCYVVTRLDQLISRVIASELAGQRIEPTDIIRTVGQYDQGRCIK